MRGMLFLGDKRVALREFPTPSGPTGRQVVVRMRASGLCGSDLSSYRNLPENLGIRAHIIAGHEPRAARSPKSAPRRATSAWATASWSTTTPAAAAAPSASPAGGTCASTARSSTAPRPTGASPTTSSSRTICAFPCPTASALRRARPAPAARARPTRPSGASDVTGRETLAVFGQGPVGLSATMFGAASGAYVIAVDPVAERRALAEKLGAAQTVDPERRRPHRGRQGRHPRPRRRRLHRRLRHRRGPHRRRPLRPRLGPQLLRRRGRHRHLRGHQRHHAPAAHPHGFPHLQHHPAGGARSLRRRPQPSR